MSTATATPAAAPVQPERPALAKLRGPRADAANMIRVHLDKGQAIRDLRIRYPDDLDQARARKLDWTQAATDLLNTLFDNPSVADYCNDWVGKIFPEYAEFGNFVEQFYEEMDHRLARLRSVLKRVEQVPDAAIAQPAAAAVAPVPAAIAPAAEPAPAHQAPEPQAPVAPPAPHRPIAAFVPPPPPANVTAGAAPAPPAHDGAPAHQRHEPHGAQAPAGLLLVQGGDAQAAEPVAQFLRQLGVEPVVVTDAAGDGSKVVEVLERRGHLSFATLLLDPAAGADGSGGDVPRDLLFHLGYCVGRMGAKRVCVMHAPGRAPIANPGGVSHIPLDPGGGWQLQLGRQMKRAGLTVDLNKLC